MLGEPSEWQRRILDVLISPLEETNLFFFLGEPYEWQCRIFGERGAPLEERLALFYALYCPEKASNARQLACEYGAGGEEVCSNASCTEV